MLLQGTYVLLPGFPFHMGQHNYGEDALQFKPQRWLSTTDSGLSISTEPAGSGADEAAAADDTKTAGSDQDTQKAVLRQQQLSTNGAKAAPPEPIPFLVGPRDW